MKILLIIVILVIFIVLHKLSRLPLDKEECEGVRHATRRTRD